MMRSLLSKIYLRKPPSFIVRHLGGAPYRIVGAERCGSDEHMGRLKIDEFTCSSSGIVVLEKTVPMELMTETGTIGASHGWVATLKDGIVCLQDDLNPTASDAVPKRISLPPLVALPHCQTQVVTNVAMSSSSPEDDGCVLAVKFLGPQLSLCRLSQKEWVNIRIQDPGFFFSSRVMFSKRHNTFSMLASGGTHIGSWDLGEHRQRPKLQRLTHVNLPEFVQSEWGKLDFCFTTEQLVESEPTGEVFMVKRFRRRKGEKMEEKEILVFKLEESGYAYHTQDIGDLCIFLSKSQPFFVKASLYDLCENSVYFLDTNEFGIIILNDKYKDTNSVSITCSVPYFFPPLYANNITDLSASL